MLTTYQLVSALLIYLLLMTVPTRAAGAEVGRPCSDLDGQTFDIRFPAEVRAKPERLEFAEGKIGITSLAQGRIAYHKKTRGNDRSQEIIFSGTLAMANGETISVEGSVASSGHIRGSIISQKPDHDATARNFNGSLRKTKAKKK